MNPINTHRSARLARRASPFFFGLVALWLAQSNASQAQTATAPEAPRLMLKTGLGVASAPKYAGSDELRSFAAPSLEAAYRTDRLGSFVLGTQGALWLPVQTQALSFGAGLSYDRGRTETDDEPLRPGSSELAGMGELASTTEGVLMGSLTLANVNTTLAVNRALRDKGHGGTHATLAIKRPIALGHGWTFSPMIGTQWADQKYMQAYFGVTPEQAARTSFSAYRPRAGLRSANLGASLEYAASRRWALNAGVVRQRWLGDAAQSPLVQTREQTIAAAGAAYQW